MISLIEFPSVFGFLTRRYLVDSIRASHVVKSVTTFNGTYVYELRR